LGGQNSATDGAYANIYAEFATGYLWTNIVARSGSTLHNTHGNYRYSYPGTTEANASSADATFNVKIAIAGGTWTWFGTLTIYKIG